MATDLVLTSDRMEARIRTLGAEVTGLSHRDHGDLLWHGDPRWWAERSPVLFPVVGRCVSNRIRVGGATYPMPLHGFARTSSFDVVESSPRHCLLRLADSPATRIHYPFAFELDLAYLLDGDLLSALAIVRNPGGAPLPASFGFHPGFRWPVAPGTRKQDHRLVFASDDHLDVARARDGFILPSATRLDLDGRTLPLSERLFDDGAMVLRALDSRHVTLTAPGAPLAITVATRNLPSLGLWMKPGADFLCIEPWAGHGDPQGFDGDIFAKPGIVAIAPGGDASFAMWIEVAAGR